MCAAPAILQVGALPRRCASFSASAGCTPTERTCSVLVWKFKTATAAADLAPAPEHSSSGFGRFLGCFETSDSFTYSTFNFNANSIPLLDSPRHAWKRRGRSGSFPPVLPTAGSASRTGCGVDGVKAEQQRQSQDSLRQEKSRTNHAATGSCSFLGWGIPVKFDLL